MMPISISAITGPKLNQIDKSRDFRRQLLSRRWAVEGSFQAAWSILGGKGLTAFCRRLVNF